MKLTPLFFLIATLISMLSGVAEAEIERFSCNGMQALSVADAEKALGVTQDWYDSHSSLQAQFKQYSFSPSVDISETSSGAVWLSNSGRMRWKYFEPEPQDFLIRGDTLWYYLPNSQQVLIDQFSSVLISKLPVAFIMGLGNLKRDFSFLSGCKKENELRLRLKPVDSNGSDSGDSELQSFVLVVSPSGKPIGAQISDVSGHLNAIELSEHKLTLDDPDKIFEADFPAGIDIIDRRLPNN